MTKWDRNKRLYEHLLAMGLYVDPVYYNGDPNLIDAIYVAADVPEEDLSSLDVLFPLEGTEVGKSIGASAGGTSNVVDFPSKF